ncbi:MAG: hypothetical protein KBC21_02435 [Candidatus Pacebacteria bacterium]|nr:hypothetical protein [Candidatus Paceibacterota bacterium]
MKKYVPYIVGIVVLFVLVYLGQGVMKGRETVAEEEVVVTPSTTLVEGTVTRFFEGEWVLGYAFDIPEAATTTVERDGSLVKVTGEGQLLSAMYFSYEGGRGYSPEDYINNVIAPNVSMVTITGTTTLGSSEWVVAEGASSVWYVASVKGGEWLVVAESKKGEDSAGLDILESLTVK